jgi:hypothetical protein
MVCRSKGQSVVQVAASRSGASLYDERTAWMKRPVRPGSPIWSAVLLVDGAPNRWRDRLVLSNEVELCELRKDAALAREIRVSLPAELSVETYIELAQTFAEQVFVRSGMIVDLNVWGDISADCEPRPWASLLMTTRRVTPAGFGKKVREWSDHALPGTLRERWAQFANGALAKNGFPATLDHRSNFDRGIDLEPQIKIGPAAMRRARAGEVMERVVENEGIKRRNCERRSVTAPGPVGVKTLSGPTREVEPLECISLFAFCRRLGVVEKSA